MKHPYFDCDRPVFDNTPFGLSVQAERQDEPGMELEGYGSAPMLEEDLNGDWSWKPNRYKRYGIKARDFKGVPPGAAELYRAKAFPRS